MDKSELFTGCLDLRWTFREEKVSSEFIQIVNSGQAIKATNYFDTVNATRGEFFLSWNAGAGRLLVPDSQKLVLREMRSAEYVIGTVGQWADRGGISAVELLFEDHSYYPFVITLPLSQCDRILPDSSCPTAACITAWTRGGQKLRLPARLRRCRELPCLEAWATDRP